MDLFLHYRIEQSIKLSQIFCLCWEPIFKWITSFPLSNYVNVNSLSYILHFILSRDITYSKATILKVLTIGYNGYIYFLCVKIQQFPSVFKHRRNSGRRVLQENKGVWANRLRICIASGLTVSWSRRSQGTPTSGANRFWRSEMKGTRT